MAKWVKGESGNPGGRPTGYGEIREIARQHTGAALNTLLAVMQNEQASPSARVSAASALLDRGCGRPETSIKAQVGPSLSEAIEAIAKKKLAEGAL